MKHAVRVVISRLGRFMAISNVQPLNLMFLNTVLASKAHLKAIQCRALNIIALKQTSTY